jgi:hypothetical protein
LILTFFQVDFSERSQIEALFRDLDRILPTLRRCQIYEALYHPRLHGSITDWNFALALIDLYVVILQSLAQVACIYERISLERAVAAFWTLGDIDQFEDRCQDLERRTEIEAENCNRKAESDKGRQLQAELS